jgi:hypothetical protein
MFLVSSLHGCSSEGVDANLKCFDPDVVDTLAYVVRDYVVLFYYQLVTEKKMRIEQ